MTFYIFLLIMALDLPQREKTAMALALSTLLLVLALSQVDAQRCPSQRGAVFLQFGTHFSRRKGAEKQIVEASPWCYGALDAVAQSEGDSVSTLKDASLEDCKSACDGEENGKRGKRCLEVSLRFATVSRFI